MILSMVSIRHGSLRNDEQEQFVRMKTKQRKTTCTKHGRLNILSCFIFFYRFFAFILHNKIKIYKTQKSYYILFFIYFCLTCKNMFVPSEKFCGLRVICIARVNEYSAWLLTNMVWWTWQYCINFFSYIFIFCGWQTLKISQQTSCARNVRWSPCSKIQQTKYQQWQQQHNGRE